MSARRTVGVLVVLLVVYAVLIGWRGVLLVQDGRPVPVVLGLAVLSRLTRTTLVENLRADYVRTAIAKGVPRYRVVGVHTPRNTLIPITTQMGADLSAIMGTAVVTETIFNLPGIGQQVAQSVRGGDTPTVVGIVTLLVIFYAFVNLFIDLLYAVLDPRIRLA